MRRALATLAALVALCALPSAHADEPQRPHSETHAPEIHAPDTRDPERVAERLSNLRATIDAVEGELRQARRQRDSLQAELARSERAIGKIQARLRELAAAIAAEERELARLREEADTLREELAAQRDALAAQLRSAYAIGRQERLKLLLNLQSVARIGRTLAYYRYFNRARAERIGQVERRLAELERVRRRIRERTAHLSELQAEQREERRERRRQRDRRREVLARIDARIQDRDQRLDDLRASRRELERVLAAIRQGMQHLPRDDPQPFAAQRGELRWPVPGRLTQHFGGPRAGDLRWTGLVIEAERGTRVRAVSHGRVAFADWLRGFGLLTVVDHGDGYMSLYGHSHSLFKEVGDWVRPGETIASVGASGGRQDQGLYFELRHNGEPVDPVPWLAGEAPPATRTAGSPAASGSRQRP